MNKLKSSQTIQLLLPAALAAIAACSNAQAGTIELFAPPNNNSFSGLSSGATAAATYDATGIKVLNPDRSWTTIGTNTPTAGYSGSPSVSLNGRYVAASVNGSNGYSQAGVYDRNTSAWTALGDLNGSYVTIGTTPLYQSSYASGISADGSTVVGGAVYSATAGSQGSSYHGVVWRNGQMYDLNASSTSTINSSRILTSNADGTLVAGYTNNNDRDSYTVWSWNGSGYSVSATPTATNPWKGTTNQHIQVDALSANGVWGAGGSSRNMGSQSFGPFGNAITFLQPTLWNSATNQVIVIPYDHVIDTDLSNDTDGSKRLALFNDVDKNAVANIAGVTNDGTVFGTFASCIDNRCNIGLSNADTFVYSVITGQSVTFDSFMASQGITLTATQHVWSLSSVAADGSAVSGLIFDSATNTSTGFLLNISAVPEPGQWALMILGLPLLALRRMRQRKAQ